ncbi:MAG: hypothetical protein M3R65_08020 [Gemmatimonadota bacterium]|nr:hypothetical protein [Gemmatimonadota bacterium]
MVRRRGAANIGCLGWILIISILAYVGNHVSGPYVRYYRFKDAVAQQVRYATFRDDDGIRKEIWAAADSLGMPEPAYHVNVERVPGAIRVFSAYDDHWELLSYIHVVRFIVDEKGTI